MARIVDLKLGIIHDASMASGVEHHSAGFSAHPAAVAGPGGLLLDICAPFRTLEGKLHLDAPTANGVRRWLDNFERLTVCAPVLPEGAPERPGPWLPVESIPNQARLSVVPLPWGYDPAGHVMHVANVRKVLRSLIPRHAYLCFSNLGWLGAWGRVAAEEAYRLGRPFAVWLDWALHEMPVGSHPNVVKRAWHGAQHAMLSRLVLRDVQRASLGLFHGKSVYNAYASLSKVARVVHNVHLGEADIIPAQQFRKRVAREAGPVRILYVGRVHEMKGPWEWLTTMEILAGSADGPAIQATWIGDGPLLGEMRQAVRARGLDDRVFFPGAEIDREALLARFRDADMFVFCHLTPESPRCLIEALMSGLPLVGFQSAYAADLLGCHGGAGAFVPVGDAAALAAVVQNCISSPLRIRSMAEEALAAGSHYSDVSVFRHRSELIKEFL